MAREYIDIVLDGPPGAEVSGQFVEVEDPSGASITVGQWLREPGSTLWRLRIRPDVFEISDETPVPVRRVCEHIRKYDGLACTHTPTWRITIHGDFWEGALACDDHLVETMDPDEPYYALERLRRAPS